MKLFPSHVFRVRRPQVFRNEVSPKRLCRSQAYPRDRALWASRFRRAFPARFRGCPLLFNPLRCRKTPLMGGMRHGRCTETLGQYFHLSLRCFLFQACPACSLLPAFPFCLRQCQRGLQLKPMFARCLLRSQVHPQPRRLLAFPSPRSPVLPAILLMRKKQRNSLPLCQKASNLSSSVPIWPPGSLASPSVRWTRG